MGRPQCSLRARCDAARIRPSGAAKTAAPRKLSGLMSDGTCALPSRICLIAPYLPKMSYISSGVILNGRLRT